MKRPTVGSLMVWTFSTLGLALMLLFVHQALLPLLAWLFPLLVPLFYDLAVYGPYPTSLYKSFNIEPPSPSLQRWNPICNTGHILISPFGASVPDAGPMILSPTGTLIWTSDAFETVMNLKVQTYRNEPFLTFWSGEKAGTMGFGSYYMLNSSYDIVHIIDAIGEQLHGDLHEFVITDKGTALITQYTTRMVDLTSMGRPTDGWIIDSLFQEIDIERNELLFSWSASDHFDPSDSHYISPFAGYKQSAPYDFFHINSVAKSSDGNYLISSRHLHAIINISPKGEILWILGGQHNEFTDLSNGAATSFTWQHDARWVDEEAGILSLFDNGSAGPIMTDAARSRALIVQVDIQNRTVKLLHEFTSLQGARSASQGSVQVLPDNHLFVGWGSSAAYTEYDLETEELLCETHFGASWAFWWERVKSYKAIKTFGWVGRPRLPPSTKIEGGRLYVSWNGATEVEKWLLEGTLGEEDQKEGVREWQPLQVIKKEGFENDFTVSVVEKYKYLRVAALDTEGSVLRYSEVVKLDGQRLPVILLLLFVVCIVLGLGVGAWLLRHKVLRNKGRRQWSDKSGYKYTILNDLASVHALLLGRKQPLNDESERNGLEQIYNGE